MYVQILPASEYCKTTRLAGRMNRMFFLPQEATWLFVWVSVHLFCVSLFVCQRFRLLVEHPTLLVARSRVDSDSDSSMSLFRTSKSGDRWFQWNPVTFQSKNPVTPVRCWVEATRFTSSCEANPQTFCNVIKLGT